MKQLIVKACNTVHMKGLAFNSMRYGKKYRLVNFGEVFDFEVLEVAGAAEFKLKDIYTLEVYFMSDLIKFGQGEDFEIREI